LKGEVRRKEGYSPAAPAELTAIPYYSWANRGPGEMTIWFPTVANVTYGQ
jgi:uncharacterized protein